MDTKTLADALKGHRLDTMSQDSGQQCVCGSDSRFTRRDGTGPWSSIDEHRAQLVLALLSAEIDAARKEGAVLAFKWASVNVNDYNMFEDDYPVSTAGFSTFMRDCSKLPTWCMWEDGDATPWLER